jgi:hypothetical protein
MIAFPLISFFCRINANSKQKGGRGAALVPCALERIDPNRRASFAASGSTRRVDAKNLAFAVVQKGCFPVFYLKHQREDPVSVHVGRSLDLDVRATSAEISRLATRVAHDDGHRDLETRRPASIANPKFGIVHSVNDIQRPAPRESVAGIVFRGFYLRGFYEFRKRKLMLFSENREQNCGSKKGIPFSGESMIRTAAIFLRPNHRLDSIIDVDFLVNVVQVRLHRMGADAKLICNGIVGVPLAQQIEYFPFLRRQRDVSRRDNVPQPFALAQQQPREKSPRQPVFAVENRLDALQKLLWGTLAWKDTMNVVGKHDLLAMRVIT